MWNVFCLPNFIGLFDNFLLVLPNFKSKYINYSGLEFNFEIKFIKAIGVMSLGSGGGIWVCHCHSRRTALKILLFHQQGLIWQSIHLIFTYFFLPFFCRGISSHDNIKVSLIFCVCVIHTIEVQLWGWVMATCVSSNLRPKQLLCWLINMFNIA